MALVSVIEPPPIDLKRAIGMAAAARLMRGRNGPPNVSTVRRWANPKCGCWPQGKDGPHLLLQTVKYNGEVLTTAEWVEEFERQRLRLGVRARYPGAAPRSSKRRAAAVRRAEARLDRDKVGGGKKP